MRHEENHLDLNNLPDDFSRDGNGQVFEDGSSSGYRKKKGGKDGKDESGKVYECRFCSLKFCKSQALGGHMNRHRQERETETLNHARQLVYRNDNLTSQGVSHFGYHPSGHIGDPTVYRSVYSPRLYPGGSSTTLIPPPPPHLPHLPPQPPQPPYLYPSPSRLPSYPSGQNSPHHPMNEYYLGHALSGNRSGSQNPNHPTVNFVAGSSGGGAAAESSYACVGAPVGHGGFPALGSGGRTPREGALLGHDGDGSRQCLDPSLPLTINRFQDHQGF